MSETPPILVFRGRNRFLSNFYPVYDDTYPSAEHRFQAIKAADPEEAAWVRSAPDPAEAKRRGRAATRRADWDEIKDRVMELVVRDKFKNPHLRRRLLATGNAHLEEGNTWGDRYWGTVNGEGENRLGKILMKIRAEIQAEEDEWS